MADKEEWRIFCAVDLPLEVREKLTAHNMRLHKEVPEAHASWSRPDNIHLTLKFLGDTPRSRVASLSKAAAEVCAGLQPFPISIHGSGVFPDHGTPRVLWIGIEDLQGKLGELYTRLEAECAKAGFKKETRPFHPHLTLARLRKPQHARELASVHRATQFDPVEIVVSELAVIKSELSSAGSKYETLSRHHLGISDQNLAE